MERGRRQSPGIPNYPKGSLCAGVEWGPCRLLVVLGSLWQLEGFVPLWVCVVPRGLLVGAAVSGVSVFTAETPTCVGTQFPCVQCSEIEGIWVNLCRFISVLTALCSFQPMQLMIFALLPFPSRWPQAAAL